MNLRSLHEFQKINIHTRLEVDILNQFDECIVEERTTEFDWFSVDEIESTISLIRKRERRKKRTSRSWTTR